MTKRILVTGSRDWTDIEVIGQALEDAWALVSNGDLRAEVVLVSGACPTGADRIAERLWEAFRRPVERHPADWDAYGKAAGPRRNQEMVNLGADICLAFPLPGSRGTRHCANAAELAGIPVLYYEPGQSAEAV